MVSDSRSYKGIWSLMVAVLLLVVCADDICYVIHVTFMGTICHKPGKPCLEL